MKHHRIISRRPAAATSALASKIDFKMSISTLNASFIPTFTGNVAEVMTSLFQNALSLSEFIELIVDDFTNGGDGGGTTT